MEDTAAREARASLILHMTTERNRLQGEIRHLVESDPLVQAKGSTMGLRIVLALLSIAILLGLCCLIGFFVSPKESAYTLIFGCFLVVAGLIGVGVCLMMLKYPPVNS